MKKLGPTTPVKNADGKDVYTLRSLGDLALLYHHLPAEKRVLLLKDLEMGLTKAADHIDKANPIFRPLLKMVIGASGPLKWIDDDKGSLTVTVKASEDSDPLWSKTL